MILHDELAIKLAENAKIIYGTFYTGQFYELILHKIQYWIVENNYILNNQICS